MSRPIKFRAWFPSECWDDKTPRMLYDQHISRHGKPMHLENGWDYMDDENEAIPMQYTGLLDKNGVEIYEGDLVKWPEKTDGVWADQAGKVQEIKWPFLYGNAQLGEVIGNIYSNPELLKGTK